MLVVVAHPDDETLTAGGLLAWLAHRCEVTLVTCTRGERGEVIGADLAPLAQDPAALGAHRVTELAAAVAALGVQRQLFLDGLDAVPTVDGVPSAGATPTADAVPPADGAATVPGARFVDSGMAWADGGHVRAVPAPDAGPDAFSVVPLERPVRLLGRVLEELRPDLVLVDEPNGGYGHPDHRRAHEVTMAAVDRAEPRPPLVAWFVRPASVVEEATRWVHDHPELPRSDASGAALVPAPPEGERASIVVPDPDVDVVVDTTAEVPQLLAAMRAHASQVHEVREVAGHPRAAGWFALSNNVLQPILTRPGLRAAPGSGDAQTLRLAVTRLAQGETGSGPVFTGLMIAFSVLLGLMMGAAGTLFHRAMPPWGLVVGLVALVAAGVLARSFVDRVGHLAYAAGVVAIVLAMTYVSPGGDVLVTDQPIGTAWLLGSVVAALLPAIAPRRVFADG